jgi:hypothetical protein
MFRVISEVFQRHRKDSGLYRKGSGERIMSRDCLLMDLVFN